MGQSFFGSNVRTKYVTINTIIYLSMWTQSVLQLFLALLFFFSLSYFGMKRAIELDCQQDFYKFVKQEWAVNVANAIPVTVILLRTVRWKMTPIHIQRAALMYLLKGIVQFVTIVPAVSGTAACVDRDFIGIVFNMDNCADMMFSGHTAITYIMAPRKIKWVFVLTVAITLVLGEIHYTSDVIVATIVASWISFVIPFETPTEVGQSKRVLRPGAGVLKFDIGSSV